MVAYLDAVLAENDPHLIVAALQDVARAQGKATAAAEAGLVCCGPREENSAGHTLDVAAVMRVMDALGLRLSVALTLGA